MMNTLPIVRVPWWRRVQATLTHAARWIVTVKRWRTVDTGEPVCLIRLFGQRVWWYQMPGKGHVTLRHVGTLFVARRSGGWRVKVSRA